MDIIGLIIFSISDYFRYLSEKPKIEVRLFSPFPNINNTIGIEIENVSNTIVTLEPNITIYLNNKIEKLFSLTLNLPKEKLSFSPFSPEKIIIPISENYNKGFITYFEFELEGKKKLKIKLRE